MEKLLATDFSSDLDTALKDFIKALKSLLKAKNQSEKNHYQVLINQVESLVIAIKTLPDSTLNVAYCAHFAAVLDLITELRLSPAWESEMLSGNLGLYLNGLVGAIQRVICRQAVSNYFSDSVLKNLMTDQPKSYCFDDFNHEIASDQIFQSLETEQNRMLSATKRLTEVNQIVTAKNTENERLLQQIKAAKFNQKAVEIDNLKQAAIKLANELIILNAAALLAADTATAAELYFKQMLLDISNNTYFC